jgi:ribosome-binding ATPase YchF (GTP1/OBG family)
MGKQGKQAEAEQNAQDAHGDTDPVAMWEAAEKQVVVLQKELDAAQADDAKAEIIKWKRIADLAQRRQNELMDTVNQREKELQRLSNILRRIGKAVDEEDTSKIAAVVEAIVRKVK